MTDTERLDAIDALLNRKSTLSACTHASELFIDPGWSNNRFLLCLRRGAQIDNEAVFSANTIRELLDHLIDYQKGVNDDRHP